MAIRNPYERFGRITKTSGSRYICFGELIERVRENDRLSPSAEKVLPHFNDNAREILGTREDGQPNWDECQDNEKYQAIQFLELQEIYDPLLVESLKFNDDEFMSRFQNRNPFMTRDEDGEIRATDEGVRICTEEFLKGLDTREADLKNPQRSVQPDSWPFYLFGTLIAKGGSIYHPRATSILSQGQREIVGDAIRKAYSTFAPYFEQAPEGETKAYFSPFFEAYVDQFVLQRELERSPKSNRPVIDLRYLSTLQESSGGQPIASSPFVVYAFNPMFEKSSWKESSKGEQFYPVLDEGINDKWGDVSVPLQQIAQALSVIAVQREETVALVEKQRRQAEMIERLEKRISELEARGRRDDALRGILSWWKNLFGRGEA